MRSTANERRFATAASEFAEAVFRGIGQVMLQESRLAGFLFLLGIFAHSVLLGLGALAGSAVGTATALFLRFDRGAVRRGVFGFNGVLTAITILYFRGSSPWVWAYAVLAAFSATVLMAAGSAFLRVWNVPVFTLPFVVVTLLFLLAGPSFGSLGVSAPLSAAGVSTGPVFFEGFLKGVGEVFLQDSELSGAIFLFGLFLSSRRAFGWSVLGSAFGLLAAWSLGAAEGALRGGTFGFNGVLVAIALGGGVEKIDARNGIYILLGILASVIVSAATSAAFAPLGLPALTLPFVLVTWVFLLAKPKTVRL